MKEEIYQWVKTLAVFYIVFSAVLHLVPDAKYERYIRSFMGILLIYILITPVFSLMGKGETMIKEFRLNYQEEMHTMENRNAEKLQSLYLKKNYTKELEKEISGKCTEAGIKAADVIVDMNGERTSVVIHTAENLTQEQERSVRNELAREFGIKEKNCQFFVEQDEQTAVAGVLTSGAFADGDRISGIKEEQ